MKRGDENERRYVHLQWRRYQAAARNENEPSVATAYAENSAASWRKRYQCAR